MKPIIAAFDDHHHADDALRWAVELSRLENAPLRVVNVFEPTYSEIAPDWMDQLLQRRHDRINRILEEIDAVGDEIVVLNAADPVAAIISYVTEHDAQMVVIGAHGSGQPGGLGASSPAHHLIQHSPVPVAVIRPDHRPLAGGIVTVGVDGSSANSGALERGERFTKAIGGTLHAVFAHDPVEDTFHVESEGWHRRSAAVSNAVSEITSVESKLYMAAGQPSEALIEHAQREHAAAIVVGTRGHGGFHGLRVGRVPMQVVAHATCPVIVVPH